MAHNPAAETTPRDLTVAMEDALAAIYRLQESTDERVGTSQLAAALDVEPPTVSSTFSKLSERGLIDREPQRPVALTEDGREVALRLVRNHRLLETFLVDRLGYGWGEVHEECDRLEHHVSPRFVRSIETLLSEPERDPHGDPIPDANLDVASSRDHAHLDTVDPGTTVRIQRILAGDRGTLEYLEERNLEPGAAITVEDRAPIGLVVVSTSSGRHQLPTDAAHRLVVARE